MITRPHYSVTLVSDEVHTGMETKAEKDMVVQTGAQTNEMCPSCKWCTNRYVSFLYVVHTCAGVFLGVGP